jgi:pyrroline-5-carboxylate reductase
MSSVSLIGAGNMARAMARGWRAGDGGPDEIFISDSGSGSAESLATEVGGVAVSGASEAFSSSGIAFLAVKPATLALVAEQAKSFSGTVVSLLAGTELSLVTASFPQAQCVRVMPNVAVEKRRGVLCRTVPASSGSNESDEGDLAELLAVLGHVVEIPERLFDAATAVMGCAPAYFALVAEAIADSGVRAGLPEDLAAELVSETLAGTAELLDDRDTLALRRAVTSPGGSTAAGLAALERGAVRAVFAEAVAASIERMKE